MSTEACARTPINVTLVVDQTRFEVSPKIQLSSSIVQTLPPDTTHVKVRDRVFRYEELPLNSLNGNTALVSASTLFDITQGLAPKNVINHVDFALTPYKSKKPEHDQVNSIKIQIIAETVLPNSTGIPDIKPDKLTEEFSKTFLGDYITEGQILVIVIYNLAFKVLVCKFTTNTNSTSYAQDRIFGELVKSSKIELFMIPGLEKLNNIENLPIYIENAKILLRVSLPGRLWENGSVSQGPYFICDKDLRKTLLKEHKGELLFIGQKWKYTENNIEHLLTIDSITDLKTGRIYSEDDERKNSKTRIQVPFDEGTNLIFELDNSKISLGDSSFSKANLLLIDLINIRTHQQTNSKDDIYFYNDELVSALIKDGNIVWNGTWKVIVKDNNGFSYTLDLKIVGGDDGEMKPVPIGEFPTKWWELDQNTQLSISIDKTRIKDAIHFCKSRKAEPVQQVTFGVRIGANPKPKNVAISKTVLKNFVQEKIPTIIKDQELRFHDKEFRLIVIEATHVKFLNESPSTYPSLGKITEQTKIKFKPHQFENKDDCSSESTLAPVIIFSEKVNNTQSNDLKEVLKTYGVGGINEKTLNELKRIKRALTDQKDLMKKLGRSPECGILFYGPTGTGKTSIAEALAKYLGAKHIIKKAATELIHSLVGKTEKEIRELFNIQDDDEELRIILLDEFESLFNQRGAEKRSWENTPISELLARMDGFNKKHRPNIIVMGMTNHIEMIDTALLRENRFGLHIQIGFPEEQQRIEILEIHTEKLRENNYLKVNLKEVASICGKLSGASLKALVNRAIDHALDRQNEKEEEEFCVTLEDFKWVINNPINDNTKPVLPYPHLYL